MLDQLTDRLGTLGLVMALCIIYPRWLLLFQLSAIIDIGSHWIHLHAADIRGATTHKQSNNPLLHLYYTSRPFLFAMCAGNEAFYGFVYLAHFVSGPTIFGIGLIPALAVLCAPIAFVKTGISLVHLVSAAQTIAEIDVQARTKTK